MASSAGKSGGNAAERPSTVTAGVTRLNFPEALERQLDSLPRFMGNEGLVGFLPEWLAAKPDLMTQVLRDGPRVLDVDIKPVESGK
jgi:hypothetical protein